jgi:hypothetical protein
MNPLTSPFHLPLPRPRRLLLTTAAQALLACAVASACLSDVAKAAGTDADRFLEHYQVLRTQFPEAVARDLALKLVAQARAGGASVTGTQSLGAPQAAETAGKEATPTPLSQRPDLKAVATDLTELVGGLKGDGLAPQDSRELAARIQAVLGSNPKPSLAVAAPDSRVQKAFVEAFTKHRAVNPGPEADEAVVRVGLAAATDEATAEKEKADQLLATAKQAEQYDAPRWLFAGGVIAVSPYRTKVSDLNTKDAVALERGKAETRGYLEFQFNQDWAWNSKSNEKASATKPDKELSCLDRGQRFFAPWVLLPRQEAFDFSLHTGFTFGDEKSNGLNDANAGTIAGSGDFYIRASSSYHIIRYGTDSFRFTWGPDLSGGMSTDLGNFEVHPYALAGMKWSVGFRPTSTWKGPQAALLMRVGYALADVPKLTELSDGSLAVAAENGRIRYDSLRGGPAFETQVLFPLSEGTMLTVGGRIMELGNADQWSFNIGLMIALDKLTGLFGFPGGKGEATPETPPKS